VVLNLSMRVRLLLLMSLWLFFIEWRVPSVHVLARPSEQHDLGLWTMKCVVHPTSRLNNSYFSPFSLCSDAITAITAFIVIWMKHRIIKYRGYWFIFLPRLEVLSGIFPPSNQEEQRACVYMEREITFHFYTPTHIYKKKWSHDHFYLPVLVRIIVVFFWIINCVFHFERILWHFLFGRILRHFSYKKWNGWKLQEMDGSFRKTGELRDI